jgi:SPX domain protein involved in polyphosphate accumulation
VVNNIYFDSPDFRHYRANVDGRSTRCKIRVRWYGAMLGRVGKPVLEIKRKHGLLGTKSSAPLLPFVLDEHFSAASARKLLRDSSVPEVLRRELDHVEPVLINHYRRRYFRSADRRVRATVDWELSFRRFHRHGNSYLDRATASRLVVLELKYSNAAASRAAEIATRFPFRMTRMSKYVFGLDHLQRQ